MSTSARAPVNKQAAADWFLRFLKGALIGTGFILPGVSGGALAAVFGLYERIINFIAHLTRDFVKNVLFFIPVGLGALAGMVILSRPLSFFLEHYEVYVLWFFIGAILGTLPALWKEAGKEGRQSRHILIMAATFLIGFTFLFFAEKLFSGHFPLNFGTWIAAGVLIALGVLVPGMSPSNFLVYMGMYKPMVDAFKTLDMLTLLPIALGAAICLFSLSKVMDTLFKKAYAGLFHFILGIVFASTVMIVPVSYNYLQPAALVCVGTVIAGAALGFWMSRLEDTYT
jgi:putative membrane protein